MSLLHQEKHRTQHIGWLRAAVLGANDGIVSIASLVIGVAAAKTGRSEVLIAGIAGLVAGAMSMAAGEYVSVSSQSDTESADIERERQELKDNIEFEKKELASLYVDRGLQEDLARQVAEQLMAHDAIAAHAREELGISEIMIARPVQAAFSSAGTFALGAMMPIFTVFVSPSDLLIPIVAVLSLVCLAMLGMLSATVGGASPFKAAMRVTFWGALAMGITAGVGAIFGITV